MISNCSKRQSTLESCWISLAMKPEFIVFYLSYSASSFFCSIIFQSSLLRLSLSLSKSSSLVCSSSLSSGNSEAKRLKLSIKSLILFYFRSSLSKNSTNYCCISTRPSWTAAFCFLIYLKAVREASYSFC